MRRRDLIAAVSASALLPAAPASMIDAATSKDWLARWERYILASTRQRFCDKELGEAVGWKLSPLLSGFHEGYLASRDTKWVGLLVEWTGAWLERGVTEPDGFLGWPIESPDGPTSDGLFASSLLGEAMAFRPVVLMAAEILRTPQLESRWGGEARRFLDLAARAFEKWDSRGGWREAKGGGVWVLPPFGIDRATNKWNDAYDQRKTGGFTHPCNKQNEIALWLLAMFDATGKIPYRDRAEQWFRVMRARMKPRGEYFVWNYWEPGGPWDSKPGGGLKHWVGVHPNGGYYSIDASAITAAFEHKLVFTREDLDRLIATNRDFMWNHDMQAAKFQRIDGGRTDPRWRNSPGLLWHPLIPYDETLRKIFIANHKPDSWGGLASTPWSIRSQTAS